MVKIHPIFLEDSEVAVILAGGCELVRDCRWNVLPESAGINLHFSGLKAGLYGSGAPSSGWVLRSRGAGDRWNDRTYPLHFELGIPSRRVSVGDRLWDVSRPSTSAPLELDVVSLHVRRSPLPNSVPWRWVIGVRRMETGATP